jgi:hypothetical protein
VVGEVARAAESLPGNEEQLPVRDSASRANA